ncbi:MAG TPA: hypothetical protein VMC79_10130 [Rectinemataceae bacterium]|nr:hypothetical protein [Rectinemataceae bacterium]
MEYSGGWRPHRAVARFVALLALVALLATACGLFHFGPGPASVHVKFDIVDGDNSFAATVYVQEVGTGETLLFPYDPHTPYITIQLKKPGKYVFYARLVEAPEDYHYGFTSMTPVAYGHMTRGGTGTAATDSLIAVDVALGGKYKAYINDYRASLPEPGEPVKVPWRLE